MNIRLEHCFESQTMGRSDSPASKEVAVAKGAQVFEKCEERIEIVLHTDILSEVQPQHLVSTRCRTPR